jgi:hypothetical protein
MVNDPSHAAIPPPLRMRIADQPFHVAFVVSLAGTSTARCRASVSRDLSGSAASMVSSISPRSHGNEVLFSVRKNFAAPSRGFLKIFNRGMAGRSQVFGVVEF